MQVTETLYDMLQNSFRRVGYHAYTLWLFTVNDLKTMVFPSTAFAISTGMSMLRQKHPDEDTQAIISWLLPRIPLILGWTWVNLLAFAVANQRSRQGIAEDKLNKPWRPIPSGRLSLAQADRLSLFTYPLALFVSHFIGGLMPASLLVVFGFLYNDMAGDGNWLVRNILNACGFTSFAAGALEVALQGPVGNFAVIWLIVIGLVVGTTVHSQDMYDQAGDAAAGRKTIPLLIGDGPARYTIAFAVLFWTWLCPTIWDASTVGYLSTMLICAVVASRSLWKRSVPDDRLTFKLYNLWLVSLYFLPLMQST